LTTAFQSAVTRTRSAALSVEGMSRVCGKPAGWTPGDDGPALVAIDCAVARGSAGALDGGEAARSGEAIQGVASGVGGSPRVHPMAAATVHVPVHAIRGASRSAIEDLTIGRDETTGAADHRPD
jgi:hypothetical protein